MADLLAAVDRRARPRAEHHRDELRRRDGLRLHHRALRGARRARAVGGAARGAGRTGGPQRPCDAQEETAPSGHEGGGTPKGGGSGFDQKGRKGPLRAAADPDRRGTDATSRSISEELESAVGPLRPFAAARMPAPREGRWPGASSETRLSVQAQPPSDCAPGRWRRPRSPAHARGAPPGPQRPAASSRSKRAKSQDTANGASARGHHHRPAATEGGPPRVGVPLGCRGRWFGVRAEAPFAVSWPFARLDGVDGAARRGPHRVPRERGPENVPRATCPRAELGVRAAAKGRKGPNATPILVRLNASWHDAATPKPGGAQNRAITQPGNTAPAPPRPGRPGSRPARGGAAACGGDAARPGS